MYGDVPSFTLQQMVQTALGGSAAAGMDKLAVEAGETATCEKCGKPIPAGQKLCRECAQKENRSETAQEGSSEGEETEKTSSVYLQKMAGAVTQIVENFGDLDWGGVKLAFPSRNIVGKRPPGSPQSGPGVGPSALETDDQSPPGPGTQSTETGEAKTHKPETDPPTGTGANPKSAPNAMGDDMESGGKQAPYPEEGVMKQATGIRQLYERVMLGKTAADAENPASISAPKTQTLTFPEDQPSQMKRPPEVTSQERLIASNQAAIDATKRQAKEVPKKRMGEVLTEPAQSRATDKVLDANLGRDTVDKGGAKVAAAKVLLQKIASQGCRCEADGLEKGSCDFCKLASRMEQRKDQMSKGGSVLLAPPSQAGGQTAAPNPQPVTGGTVPGIGT